MTSYMPLGTKVLIKKLPKEEKKQGVILSLNEPKDKMIGTVIEVAHSNCIVSVNDVIRYAPYTAQMIDETDPEYLIVDEKDIWCIVRKDSCTS